jgi:hypothetical protein
MDVERRVEVLEWTHHRKGGLECIYVSGVIKGEDTQDLGRPWKGNKDSLGSHGQALTERGSIHEQFCVYRHIHV